VVEKKEFARGEKRNEESEKQLLKPLVKKGLIFKRQSDKKKQKTTKTNGRRKKKRPSEEKALSSVSSQSIESNFSFRTLLNKKTKLLSETFSFETKRTEKGALKV
jgi:hypothetical protein